jgi:ADP-ribose pyrophosphatase YjhB (NUDIX family)
VISFRVGSHRFHYRAGAVAIHQSHVLLHRLEGDSFWALPGGRVNPGETARDAVVREFLEELGVRVSCKELLSTGENFFDHQGEPHHEVGLYFEVAFSHGSPLLDKTRPHAGTEAGRRLEFKWYPLHTLGSIDVRPAALKQPLSTGALPRHFVQHG